MLFLVNIKTFLMFIGLFFVGIYVGWTWLIPEKNETVKTQEVATILVKKEVPVEDNYVKENNFLANLRWEREEFFRQKMGQLYAKGTESALPVKEREKAMMEYYKLAAESENIKILEKIISKKGFREVYIKWRPENKMVINVDETIDKSMVEEIALLAEQYAGVSRENIIIKYLDKSTK